MYFMLFSFSQMVTITQLPFDLLSGIVSGYYSVAVVVGAGA